MRLRPTRSDALSERQSADARKGVVPYLTKSESGKTKDDLDKEDNKSAAEESDSNIDSDSNLDSDSSGNDDENWRPALGDRFPSKDAAIEAIRRWGLKRGYEYTVGHTKNNAAEKKGKRDGWESRGKEREC